MSSPATRGTPQGAGTQAASQVQSTAQATQPQSTTPAQAGAAQATASAATSSPAPAKGSSDADRSRWTTPARLRLARGLATAAALLTGVVATGTFDTSGVNPTPNVIASQWEASERAGAEVAAAQLEVARGAAESAAQVPSEDRLSDPGAFRTHLGDAEDLVARSGGSHSASLVDVALTGQEALRASDPAAAATAYQEVADLTGASLQATDAVAEEHAHDLRTGSRSGLTAVVGGLATLLLGGLLVWLALLSRRILNLPLLVATAITAGLTYVSLNPAALPLDIDQRVDTASQASQALQDVRLARAAQYAQVLGVDPGPGAVQRATRSVTALGDRGVSDDWRTVFEGQEELDAAGEGAEALTAVRATQEAFAGAESALVELVDDRLGSSVGDVGRPALLTSGLGLVLGVVAAGLAWTGLTQRLRDYR